MKKLMLLIAALMAIVTVDAKPKQEASELNLRIGSYNVWSHSARKWALRKAPTIYETRNWDASKKSVAKLINKLDCDLIGMQEMTSVCRDDLKKLVSKKYELWWVNTYPEGHKSVVGNAVFFKKKAFELSEQAIYYFSPTPEVMSKGWDCKRHYRAALTAVVTHKKSGKKFFFIATHGPLKKEANGHAGRLLVEFDKKYNKEGLPTIVVGDMNARPGQTFHNYMLKHFEDSFLVAKEKCETIGTFNGSGEREKNFTLPNRRIDHIYVRSTDKGKVTVNRYEVNRDKLKCGGVKHYPSDHNPVYVDLTIQ
ncbi:MAG: endonuclease/exonuclease/phosphatase family protein [Alistipes sp.]|nr:endonuclease/exonuclease/phosphatase family protein [Alistipes sp.]